jgi:hypothetical protein
MSITQSQNRWYIIGRKLTGVGNEDDGTSVSSGLSGPVPVSSQVS